MAGSLITKETFADIVFPAGVAIGAVVIIVTCVICYRKGIDITSRSFGLVVALSCIAMFLIIPIFFSEYSIGVKIVASILALCVGIIDYFVLDTAQRRIQKSQD